jgi:uncharacterized membrane protein
MPIFTIFKYLHILLAITAVGFNISYAIWLQRAARSPQHLDFALRGIKFLDDYIANPAYLGLFATGLIMVLTASIPLSTFWISAAMGLWVILLIGGFGFYTPTLRSQIKTLEAEGADSAAFKQLNARGTVIGIFLAVVVLIILFLMVFKPNPFGS